MVRSHSRTRRRNTLFYWLFVEHFEHLRSDPAKYEKFAHQRHFGGFVRGPDQFVGSFHVFCHFNQIGG